MWCVEIQEFCVVLLVLAVICVREVEGHRMVLRVVAELLGDGGIAKEEGEVGEHVLTGGRNGAGSRKLLCAVDVGLLHR